MVQDTPVDGVEERAGQITDEGTKRHGRACYFPGNMNLVHGSKEDGAHAEYTGADAEGHEHAEIYVHMAVGQERKDSQGCSRNNKYNAQIFCGGMEYLIGQVAAHRTAQHFQGILVDNTISAN